jgi:hypothetical protein
MSAEERAAALGDIVRACALDGDSWGALAAQLSADALVLSEIVARYPGATINEAIIGAPVITGTSVDTVIQQYRNCLLASLEDNLLARVVEEEFAPLDMANLPLLPENVGEYAQSWAAGQPARSYVDFHEDRAAKLYVLARGLLSEGDFGGFQRTVYAADTSTFLAHHSRESERVGDIYMTLLRTGMLLAEYALSSLSVATDAFAAVNATRDAFEWATITAARPQWGIVPDGALAPPMQTV